MDEYNTTPNEGQVVVPAGANQQPIVLNINNVNTNSNVNTNNNVNGYGGLAVSSKSKMVTLLLCLFLGYFGAHCFYVGKIGRGVLYLFTFGLLGIGWIWDIIQILLGRYRDKYGLLIVR